MAGKRHLGKVPLRNAHALCVVLSSVKLENVLDSLEKQWIIKEQYIVDVLFGS